MLSNMCEICKANAVTLLKRHKRNHYFPRNYYFLFLISTFDAKIQLFGDAEESLLSTINKLKEKYSQGSG